MAGLDARHTIFSHWSGRRMGNSFGLQVRNDWINNGLYATQERVRMDKTDHNTDDGIPTTLPTTTERDSFTDTIGSVYAENKIQWANKFRSVVALRGDDEKFVVTSLAYPSLGERGQFRLGHQVSAQPKSKFDLRPVGQY